MVSAWFAYVGGRAVQAWRAAWSATVAFATGQLRFVTSPGSLDPV
jgi:hypothetical protein